VAIKAHGRIVFWEGASLWVLGTPDGTRYPRTAVHSHHALQVTLSLRGRFSLVDRGRLVNGGAAAVAADAQHAFEAEGVVAHLFIDPDGREGRAIAQRLFARERVVALVEEDLSGLMAELLVIFESRKRRDELLVQCGRRLVARLAAEDAAATRPDARVRKMIAFAATGIDRAVTLAAAAAHVGLSNGRARHLFVAETGLPFRVYLLWLRLTKAVQAYATGETLTGAAHAAGFSDSAHLSRTFRRMFGIPADSLRLM
jgi:AraC-like DNA-binding protein